MNDIANLTRPLFPHDTQVRVEHRESCAIILHVRGEQRSLLKHAELADEPLFASFYFEATQNRIPKFSAASPPAAAEHEIHTRHPRDFRRLMHATRSPRPVVQLLQARYVNIVTQYRLCHVFKVYFPPWSTSVMDVKRHNRQFHLIHLL
jgi:hypothetical protein